MVKEHFVHITKRDPSLWSKGWSDFQNRIDTFRLFQDHKVGFIGLHNVTYVKLNESFALHIRLSICFATCMEIK